jgi:hypothetical protein
MLAVSLQKSFYSTPHFLRCGSVSVGTPQDLGGQFVTPQGVSLLWVVAERLGVPRARNAKATLARISERPAPAAPRHAASIRLCLQKSAHTKGSIATVTLFLTGSKCFRRK